MKTSAPQELRTGLAQRHMSMIAIAGVIGAGLFVGSGAVIHAAGPAAVIAYATAGVIVVLVMRMLGEMSVMNPDSGSFSTYADRAIGRWAGFSIGWLYAWFWIVLLGVEATAGALILHRWLPGVPQWAFALALMVVLTLTNLASVASYGEFEFWFAGIKVVAIAAFLVVGLLAAFGAFHGFATPGLENLVAHGGVFPNGLLAAFSSILVVVFSYFGSEIATIAAGESANPSVAVRKAVNSVVWRILVYYVGSIALIVTLLPWDSASIATSPFVAVLDAIGIPVAAVIMDVVVLVAVLSCLNSGLYTASRMLYSLARRGDAPALLARTSANGAPRFAVLAATVVGFVTVGLNYLYPDTVFLFLLNSSGAIALFVWLVIAVSQIRTRRAAERRGEAIPLRMWGFPVLSYAVIVVIVMLCAAMFFQPDTFWQITISLAIAVAVSVIGVVRQRRAAAETRSAAGSATLPAADADVV